MRADDEELELEEGTLAGIRVVSYEGAPWLNGPEAMRAGTESFQCFHEIATRGTFEAKFELATFAAPNYEEIRAGLNEAQRRHREYARQMQQHRAEAVLRMSGA